LNGALHGFITKVATRNAASSPLAAEESVGTHGNKANMKVLPT